MVSHTSFKPFLRVTTKKKNRIKYCSTLLQNLTKCYENVFICFLEYWWMRWKSLRTNEFTKFFRVAVVMGCQRICSRCLFKANVWLDAFYMTSVIKKVLSLTVNKREKNWNIILWNYSCVVEDSKCMLLDFWLSRSYSTVAMVVK